MTSYTIQYYDGPVPGYEDSLFSGPTPAFGDELHLTNTTLKLRVLRVEHHARIQPTATYAVRVVVIVEAAA